VSKSIDPPELSELAQMSAGTRPKALWPAPTTAIVGVVGFPVSHSLSPRLHNAAYAVMGLDWCYHAFEVPPGSLDTAVVGAAALGLRGLSVTMPHKEAAARVATRHSRQVRRLGAANTLIFLGTAIRAESCDGDGLLDDLRQGAGFDPAGRRCGVIGAGGAGRAVVLALAEAGAAEIVVVNRTAARAWRAVALAPRVVHVGRPEDLRGMDLVVQATPAGMPEARSVPEVSPARLTRSLGPAGSGTAHRSDQPVGPQDPSRSAGQPGSRPPESGADRGGVIAGVDPSWFGAGQLVVDLVYDPPVTPFLIEAERQGATVRSGLGMLVHQAARQIRFWTGAQPPLEVMWAVVRGHGDRSEEPTGYS